MRTARLCLELIIHECLGALGYMPSMTLAKVYNTRMHTQLHMLGEMVCYGIPLL